MPGLDGNDTMTLDASVRQLTIHGFSLVNAIKVYVGEWDRSSYYIAGAFLRNHIVQGANQSIVQLGTDVSETGTPADPDDIGTITVPAARPAGKRNDAVLAATLKNSLRKPSGGLPVVNKKVPIYADIPAAADASTNNSLTIILRPLDDSPV